MQSSLTVQDHKEQKQNKNLLVIASEGCQSSQQVLKQLFKVIKPHSQIKTYSFEKYLAGETTLITKFDLEALDKMQLVVVLGQKKDLLQAFSLFSNKDSPPILGFGMSEDYTTPLIYNFDTFHTEQIEELIDTIIGELNWNNLPTDNLMKLSLTIDCKKIAQATAQIEIHRGIHQNVIILNLYILNKCQKQKIKIGTFKGDGLLISTPMGTVCKSMSLNGPLMNRNMQNILVTPICPLSMKFRTLCLPADTHLYLQLDESCRTNSAEIYVDQTCKELNLKKGEWLRIKMSTNRTRMISSILQSNEEYFIRTLRNGLRWGQAYLPVEMPSFKIKKLSSLQ